MVHCFVTIPRSFIFHMCVHLPCLVHLLTALCLMRFYIIVLSDNEYMLNIFQQIVKCIHDCFCSACIYIVATPSNTNVLIV